MNPCAACNERRLHTPAEWEAFHPLAGHGYADPIGWSHPALAKENIRVAGNVSLACPIPTQRVTLETASEREEAEVPQLPAHSTEPGKGDE